MITIPMSILLIAYAVVILLYLFFSAICVHHIIRTASFTTIGFLVTFFVLSAGVLTIYGSWYLLQEISWVQSITLFDNSPIGSVNF